MVEGMKTTLKTRAANSLATALSVLAWLTLVALKAVGWTIRTLFPPVGENETNQEFTYRIITQAIWVIVVSGVIVVLVTIALCL